MGAATSAPNDSPASATLEPVAGTAPELDAGASAHKSDTGRVFQQNETPRNATPPRHENPDEAESNESLSSLRAALASRLSTRLRGSSVNISQGEYDRARRVLGDEYTGLLSEYADVAEQQGDERTAENFREARDEQTSLAENVSEYQRTQDAYREAKANGNDARARELARRMNRLASNVSDSSARLNRTYADMEENVSQPDSPAGSRTRDAIAESRQRVSDVSQNVSRTQREIREQEFTQTTLRVKAADESASFTDPIEVTGTLQTADGDPVAEQTVRIGVGNRRYTVDTDEGGSFALTYRPVTVPAGTTGVPVRYLPDDASLYLGSNATAPVAVEQTTGTVRVRNVSTGDSSRDPIRVAGDVRVERTPVGGLPLVISVGDSVLATTRTDANGSFAVSGRLDERPTAETQSVGIRTQQTDRAVVVNETPTSVQFDLRPPTLTVETQVTDDGDVRVFGRLAYPDGTPVPDEPLVVLAAGEELARTTTGANGTYSVTVDEEAIPTDASEIVVRRASNQSGSASGTDGGAGLGNAPVAGAGSSGVSAPVPVQSEGVAFGALDFLTNHRSAGVVFAVVVAGVVSSLYVLRRRRLSPPDPTNESEGTGPAGTAAGPESTGATSDPGQSRPSLDPAEDALERGATDDAVAFAYGAVRARLLDEYPVDERATHWQFYRSAERADVPERESLRALTETYERARYGPVRISSDAARAALDAAQRVWEASADADRSD